MILEITVVLKCLTVAATYMTHAVMSKPADYLSDGARNSIGKQIANYISNENKPTPLDQLEKHINDLEKKIFGNIEPGRVDIGVDTPGTDAQKPTAEQRSTESENKLKANVDTITAKATHDVAGEDYVTAINRLFLNTHDHISENQAKLTALSGDNKDRYDGLSLRLQHLKTHLVVANEQMMHSSQRFKT